VTELRRLNYLIKGESQGKWFQSCEDPGSLTLSVVLSLLTVLSRLGIVCAAQINSPLAAASKSRPDKGGKWMLFLLCLFIFTKKENSFQKLLEN
jgi:hypothetical protein